MNSYNNKIRTAFYYDKEFELNYVHEQHQLAVELLSLGLSVLMDIFEII